MTIKQKQCLLCYLGCYDGIPDGIWGEQSIEGTRQFQQRWGLEADGIFGPATEAAIRKAVSEEKPREEIIWEDIQYFRPEEFACKCGKCGGWPGEVSRVLLCTADRVREHFDSPAVVSSGLRCPEHNTAVGGAAASRHMTGRAMDFRIAGKNAGQVLAFVQAQPEIRYAYAIDGQYVHMDVF